MRTATDHSSDRHLPTLSQLGGDLLRVTRLQLLTTLALPFVAMGSYAIFVWWPCWPLAVASVMMLSFYINSSSGAGALNRPHNRSPKCGGTHTSVVSGNRRWHGQEAMDWSVLDHGPNRASA
jgi:hypothetical protein